MNTNLIVFPLEKATCFFCLGEFNRRQDQQQYICPECRENVRLSHEHAEDCKRILRESVAATGGDVAAYDAAVEQHLQSIRDGTWNPAA